MELRIAYDMLCYVKLNALSIKTISRSLTLFVLQLLAVYRQLNERLSPNITCDLLILSTLTKRIGSCKIRIWSLEQKGLVVCNFRIWSLEQKGLVVCRFCINSS